jgi:hypothetical protein
MSRSDLLDVRAIFLVVVSRSLDVPARRVHLQVMEATGGARILHETSDRSMTLATRGSLFITIHRRDYSPQEIALLHRFQLSFARERGAPIPLLTILDVTEKHIVRFSKEAREATLALAHDMAPHTRCSAVVFDRGGFAGSAIRSLVTTVNFLSRQPFPTHVFGDLDAALEWIELKLDKERPADFDRAGITTLVRGLREASPPPQASSDPP